MDLFSYSDYRVFLRDLYFLYKSQNKRYSYQKFAEDLGFTASNFMHLVLTKKRNLSEDAVARIQKHMNWNAQQKKFFSCLVKLNQTKNQNEILRCQKELQQLLTKRRALIKDDQFEYFSNWYVPVLKEIIGLKGFVSNLNWIAKKIMPHVSEDKIKQALQILERLGFVSRHNNQWRQIGEHLITPSEVSSDQVHNYHKQMLGLSLKALDLEATQRDISALTMSVSPRQLNWLKARIVAFRDEIQQELQGSNEEASHIAQLNMQLFPVTKTS